MKKLIIACFCLLFYINLLLALNRGEIREQIRFDVNDTTETTISPRWTNDILNKRINIVQTEMVGFTKCLYTKCLIQAVTDQIEYRMPTDLIIVDRVSFLITGTTTAYKKLDCVTQVGMDRDVPNWENLGAGLPRSYYERGNYIGLYPKPAGTYCSAAPTTTIFTTSTIKIDYYKKATDMTTDSAEPFDGDYSLSIYSKIIVLGVDIMCKKDEQKWNEVHALQSEYNTWLNIMKDLIRDKPDKSNVKIDFRIHP